MIVLAVLKAFMFHFLISTIIVIISVESKPQEFQFETSNQGRPVTDFSGLKQVLSRRNHNPATLLTTPQVLELYGYPAESHKVTTRDGYILTMHRIPHGKNYKGSSRLNKPVIFLQHGLFASSFEWFMNSPDKLLALQLADAGYDVWLGNARGNAYSREHVRMTVRDRNFWEYSMHEMGKYDLPAEIDHVLQTTGNSKINYIGFSMGTSMFWIMMSLHPEYNEKIKLMTAFAPVVYINNMKGFPRILLAPFDRILKVILDWIGNGEFLPPWLLKIYTAIGSRLCQNTFFAEAICANINFLYAGWDLPQTQFNQIPLFYGHTPSPTSTRTLTHITQLINTGVFGEYNFGPMENQMKYKSGIPPRYSLQNTKIPVALLWGENDAVVDPIDVRRLVTQLPNIVLNMRVNFTLWNHFDYHLARDANELINQPVMKLLSNYT